MKKVLVTSALHSPEVLNRRILWIREQKVMIDADLADVYGVKTKVLNQAVKRNLDRFPPEFMFRLTVREKGEVVTNCDHLENLRYSPTLPYAFTEHGAVMAANVLNSPQAVRASIFIVRAFIKIREMLSTQKELAQKLAELESRIDSQDESLRTLIVAIRELANPPPQRKGRIGFRTAQ